VVKHGLPFRLLRFGLLGWRSGRNYLLLKERFVLLDIGDLVLLT
jgi:hypothetical protein